MRRAVQCVLMGAAFLVAGCGSPPDSGTGDTSAAEDHGDSAMSDTVHAEHDVGHEAGGAMALLPIMRQLADEMAGLQNALWLEDFAEVEARTAAIAEHAHISGEEFARIRAELGAEMAEFEEADATVHEAAVRMHVAARERNTADVLDQLAAVQRGCVSCHARFRERLRTTE